MRGTRATASATLAIAALQECRDLATGKGIHSSLLASSKPPLAIAVANTLVTMYARCGSTIDARHVFEAMPRRSVVSWNALLFAYVHSGESSRALELFQRMLLHDPQGLAPNSLTYIAALNACACCCESRRREGTQVLEEIKLEFLKRGIWIHSRASKSGMERDLKVASSLIDMYTKCGSLADALRVFHKLILPDVVCWNAIILGCAHGGRPELALELLSQMEEQHKLGDGGVLPDSWTFAAALKACAEIASSEPARQIDGKLVRVSSLDRGMAIRRQMERDGGHESDIVVANAVLDMYAKCGSMLDARRYFQLRMKLHDVVSWNTIIQGCVDEDEPQLAVDYFARLRELGDGRVVANEITLVAALQACGALGDLEAGRRIHDELSQSLAGTGRSFSTTLGTSLVDFYGKCGSMVDARRVFHSMASRDTVAWNALISGYARLGDTEQVFELFEAMERGQIKADGVTFLSILSACGHAGRVAEGKEFFRRMSSEFKIAPGVEHLCCMVDLLSRANHLREAVGMLLEQRSNDSVINGWRTVLAASRKWKNVEIGELAFQAILRADDQDGAAYVLMANIYASAGMWDKSAALQSARIEGTRSLS